MANIRRLKGIDRAEVDRLRGAGIQTIEQLWVRISPEQDNGFTDLANKARIDQSRLIELLSTEGLRRTGKPGARWLKKHWLDVVLIIGMLLLVARVWSLVR